MKMPTAVLHVSFGIALLTSTTFAATTRSVCPSGCTYPTIQSAIDAAGADDTILIAKGHYVENLNTEGKRLTLQGSDRLTTIIDGNGKGTTITIPGTKLVVISDVTITRGSGDGGGIALQNNLNLRHSIVVANHSTTSGGGIRVSQLLAGQEVGQVTVRDCSIVDNSATSSGGGLVAEAVESVTLTIRDSLFARNSADKGLGGAIAVDGQADQIVIDHTNIVDNRAPIGGGVAATSDYVTTGLTITNSTVSGNTATGSGSSSSTWNGQGGGVFIWGVGLHSTHNTISQNMAATDGGGINLAASNFRPRTSAAYEDTWIIMNKAGHEGGGVAALGVPTTVGANVVVADNTPDNCPASQATCP